MSFDFPFVRLFGNFVITLIESLLYPIPFLYDPKTMFEVVKWYGVVIVIVCRNLVSVR